MVYAYQQGAARSDKSGHDLRYFGSNHEAMIAARPQDLLSVPAVLEIANIIKDIPALRQFREFGMELSTLKQVVLSGDPEQFDRAPFSIYLDNAKPLVLTQFTQGLPSFLIGDEAVKRLGTFDTGLWQPEDKTLVVNELRSIRRFVQNRTIGQDFLEVSAWKRIQSRPIAILIRGDCVRKRYDIMRRGGGTELKLLNMMSTVADEIEWVSIGISADKDLKVLVVLQGADSIGAAKVESYSTKLVEYAQNQLRAISETIPNQDDPRSELINVVLKAIETRQNKVQDNSMMIAIRIPFENLDLGKIASAAKTGLIQKSSLQNLNEIAVGILNFESVYKRFPESKMMVNPASPDKPRHSWRVALLPFIGHADLYDQYKREEPWDSENNIKLLEKIPAIYRHPGAPSNSTFTSYVGLVGSNTAFRPEGKVGFQMIEDGTSNTIAVVDAKTEIPWTKPEDLGYKSDGPLPDMGGYSPDGFNVVMLDASVKFIDKNTPEKAIRAMITASGGEAFAQ